MELEDLPGDPTILATPTQETGRPTPEVAIPMDTSLHEQPHNYDPLSKPVPLITMATTDSEPGIYCMYIQYMYMHVVCTCNLKSVSFHCFLYIFI